MEPINGWTIFEQQEQGYLYEIFVKIKKYFCISMLSCISESYRSQCRWLYIRELRDNGGRIPSSVLRQLGDF